jgi:sulfide:quinone oxidoreductase
MAGHQAPLDGYYNGYGCCPLLVGKNRVVLAEFGFEGAILETFDRKKGKFPYSLLGQEGLLQEMFFAWMKKRLFSFVYWNLYPKGLWFGTNVIWKPDVRKK